MPSDRPMIDRDAALGLIRYTRHFSTCEVEQRTSPLCTCGLAAALETAFPDLVANARAFAAMGRSENPRCLTV